jgi:phosphoadenosine phosphosulfate reductase
MTNKIPTTSFSPLLHKVSRVNPLEALRFLCDEFPGKVVFSTSFSAEDQVITHIILSNLIPVSIFTLDTGRFFAETYSTWVATNDRYGVKIKGFYPDRNLLEEYIDQKGPNGFYGSVGDRKQCCFIRKVERIQRALAGNAVWVTGLRAEHSPERKELDIMEWDPSNNIIKYNPVLGWSGVEIKKFIDEHQVPYNILHDKGFLSIGCAPCTRAVRPGEDMRAGRWWWEEQGKKECGLHAIN